MLDESRKYHTANFQALGFHGETHEQTQLHFSHNPEIEPHLLTVTFITTRPAGNVNKKAADSTTYVICHFLFKKRFVISDKVTLCLQKAVSKLRKLGA